MKSKKALSVPGKIAAIIIFIVVLLLTLNFIFDWELPTQLKVWLPDFLLPDSSDSGEVVDYGFGCPVQIAIVENDFISFCNPPGEECGSPQSSEIYLDGDEIFVSVTGSDAQIGTIASGNIFIRDNVKKGVGDENDQTGFQEVIASTTREQLINLDSSYFISSAQKTICRDKTTSYEEYRDATLKTTRTIEDQGKTFYINLDGLIQNRLRAPHKLYLDKELTQEAASFLEDEGDTLIRRQEPSEGSIKEGQIYGKSPIEKSPQDLRGSNNADPYTISQSLDSPDWIELNSNRQLPNPNGEVGFDTDGHPIDEVAFTERNGRIYITFRTTIGINDELGYFLLLDYWNAYRTLGNVPDWAKLS